MGCLQTVAAADPEAWIAAGFLRTLVFDRLAGVTTQLDDVDVVTFGDGRSEARLLARLRQGAPEVPWSVKDQARMHQRNGDDAYTDLADALCHWPETATAVAARIRPLGIEILAPLGLHDLFAGRVRPTPHMRSRADRRQVFAARLHAKRWSDRWPGLEVADSPTRHLGG